MTHTDFLDRPKFDLAEFKGKAGLAAALMRVLSNDNRLMILCLLGGGELSVGDIGVQIPLSQSALSQHLARLRDDHIVQTRRDGQTIFYSIANRDVLRVIETLASIYCPEMLT